MTAKEHKFHTVMIVDDNKIDLYINSQVIERCDFGQKTLQYSSAEMALEYLRTCNDLHCLPQVIFVDIYMPGMSGFEFMEAYGQLSPDLKKSCKVYVISSSIDEQDIKYVDANPNIIAFHEKPLSRAYLETILP